MPMRSWPLSDRQPPAADIRRYALQELALRLHRLPERRAIFEQAIAWAAGQGYAAAVAQSEPDDTLHIEAFGGLTSQQISALHPTTPALGESTLAGYAALHECIVLVENIESDTQFAELRGLGQGDAFRSALALPLLAGPTCQGVLLICATGGLDACTIGLFELLARHMAEALGAAARLAELEARAAQAEQRYGQLRRAYDLIAAERRTLATVLECASEAILVTDAEGIVQLGNRAVEGVLDVHADLLIARPLGHAGTPEGLTSLLERARARGEQQEAVLDFPNDRTFQISVAPVESFDQPPQAYVILLKDVTTFKQLDAMKNRFVATVSHDMKSPLNIIGSYAELLELSGGLDEEQAEYVRRILASVRRLSALVSDLLDLARIESGAGLRRAPVDIGAIILSAVEEQRLAADAKHIDIRLERLAGAPLVRGDTNRLRQVVHNLLSNALTYTRPDGAVWLSAEVSQGVALVRVEDSGIGIGPQDIPHIFEPFFRAGAAKALSDAGTGLGLAIVKRIVDEHGGTIGVESAINGGSTFWFTLPLAQPIEDRG
jgi:signal transduction histidine kinase